MGKQIYCGSYSIALNVAKTGIRQIYTATGALGGVQTEDMFSQSMNKIISYNNLLKETESNLYCRKV